MQSEVIRIVQISDVHLFADLDKSLLGIKTNESFHAVLELLKIENTKPNLILLTGDISQDETTEAYNRIADKLNEFNVPIFCIPGNHDDVRLMQELYPRGRLSMDKQITAGNWQIILLNSQKFGAVEGYLSEEELNFLEDCLQNSPQQFALVSLHHHPVPMRSAWLDNLGLKNAEAFWQVLANYPQVKIVLFGHVHQEFTGKINGISYYSSPSTCIQFKTKTDKFTLDPIPPGYRILDLYPDGSYKTEVHRLREYIGVFDPDAKGY